MIIYRKIRKSININIGLFYKSVMKYSLIRLIYLFIIERVRALLYFDFSMNNLSVYTFVKTL